MEWLLSLEIVNCIHNNVVNIIVDGGIVLNALVETGEVIVHEDISSGSIDQLVHAPGKTVFNLEGFVLVVFVRNSG
jgi:hypothetical protein